MTPMWAKPRAAPPPSARPMRGGFGSGRMTTGGTGGTGSTSGGGVSGGGVTGAVGGAGGTVWHAVSKTTISAQSSLAIGRIVGSRL
jgi:hypothetical protein